MLVYGVWLALAGGIAMVAGLAASLRRRRLQRNGVAVRAMILPTPSDAADAGRTAAVSIQFALEDGRVIERGHGPQGRRPARLRPGDRVLVWYDPADPTDVVVYGSDGRWSDRAFLVSGVVLFAVGVVLAGFGR